MAGLGVYKLDNGESFPTNCFPVRSLFLQSKEGAGHWFIAHRSSVENRYSKAKQPSSADPFHTAPSVLSESEKPERKTPENAENTLNTQLLMKLHCVDKPSDLCSVDISERKLDSVTLEGLEECDSVAYINASDNHLTLDCFSSFPALRELELSLNSLCTLKVHAVDFPKLQVLDLSYNYLSSDAVLALGLLPCLKVLHLTGNNLQMLPLNMAGPYTPPDEPASQPGALFQNLEVLMLDDNKLSSPEVFNSLANLKRLQHLNLEGNCISEVPYLQPIPTASVPQSQATTTETTLTRGFSDHHLNTEVVNLESEEEFIPPLPQLQYLNLAHNKIAEEEALLAVALFPSFSELIIHSNPLTTHRTGDPPVLTCFLQDRLGINIVRKKSTYMLKPHLVLPVDHKRKVRTKIPKVPKVPLIKAAECPSETRTTAGGAGRTSPVPSDWRSNNASLLCSPSTSTVEMENDVTAPGGPEIMHEELPRETSSEIQVDEPFFVTEIKDLLESEDTEEIINLRECPEKLIGFEALLDDDDDDDDSDSQSLDIPEPAGIQQSVRVLEHTLKNLLVYRFSREDLESLQRPPRGQRKMNLPPAKSLKPSKENVKEILSEMKERKSIREVPLEKVLQNRDKYRKEYEEALTLLKDMKRKYKMVYVKAAEHAAQIESINQSSE